MKPFTVLLVAVIVIAVISLLVGWLFPNALNNYWNVRVTEVFQAITAAFVIPYIAYLYQDLLIRQNKRIEIHIKIVDLAETKIHEFINANLQFMESKPSERTLSPEEVLHGFKMARKYLQLIEKLYPTKKSNSTTNKTISSIRNKLQVFDDLITGEHWNLHDPEALTYEEAQILKAQAVIEEITIELQECKVKLLNN